MEVVKKKERQKQGADCTEACELPTCRWGSARRMGVRLGGGPKSCFPHNKGLILGREKVGQRRQAHPRAVTANQPRFCNCLDPNHPCLHADRWQLTTILWRSVWADLIKLSCFLWGCFEERGMCTHTQQQHTQTQTQSHVVLLLLNVSQWKCPP